MKKILVGLIFVLMGFFAFACNPVTITPKIPVTPGTPTSTGTSTPTRTLTATLTPSPTKTMTPGPTLTSVPTCSGTSTIIYSDNFSSSSTLPNYEFVDKFANGATVQITGGEMLVTPPSSGLSGAMILVTKAAFSHSLSDYTLDFDGKMDTLNGYGVFGASFRGDIVSSTSMTYYAFIWNGNPENNPPHWQTLSYYGNGIFTYNYLGGSSTGGGPSTPLYTPGNWVHFTVVCKGTNFTCSVDNGSGSVVVYNFSDSSYPAGGVGFETEFIQAPNLVHFKNLVVRSCP